MQHAITGTAATIAAGLSALLVSTAAYANDVFGYTPPQNAPMTAQQIQSARPIMPMLQDASQIPGADEGPMRGTPRSFGGSSGSSKAAKDVPSASDGVSGSAGVAPQGFGTSNHPFTTKGAFSTHSSSPTNLHPWRVSGKLSFVRGGQSFVCSASLIKKGIVVTAAHCVNKYGTATFNSSTTFQPARYDGTSPYGSWTATRIYVPTVYRNGTDECTTAGVVCANDVAVIVLNPQGGAYPGTAVGWYGYGINGYGYTNSTFLTKNAAEITQLGYPCTFSSCIRMIRTDSLGYFATPNNVIIGSDQTGGSSGGPWLVNFGATPVSTNSVPSENNSNVVVATTSWGYISNTIKQQGASRFGTNSKFPSTANITALVNAACAAYPSRC
jgi:V8-like Glu-specific endopeptidase